MAAVILLILLAAVLEILGSGVQEPTNRAILWTSLWRLWGRLEQKLETRIGQLGIVVGNQACNRSFESLSSSLTIPG